MIYIKEVVVDDGKKYSPVADGIFRLEYREDEWTNANPELISLGLGVCVYGFDSMEEFISWKISTGRNSVPYYLEIWQVEVEDKVTNPFPHRMFVTDFYDFDQANGFRNKKKLLAKLELARMPWPKHTFMFEKIKLLRKVV